MLIAPSSLASRLQPPTQRSEVGQTFEIKDVQLHNAVASEIYRTFPIKQIRDVLNEFPGAKAFKSFILKIPNLVCNSFLNDTLTQFVS